MNTRSEIGNGLSELDVQERIATGRTNAFTPETSRSWWNIVRANVLTLFNFIVLGCFALLFALGRWQDALFGFAAISNLVVGSFQEIRAKIALDRLALLHAPHAKVRRDGTDVEVLPGEVVADDLLALYAGDQVPADGEVVWASGLQLDESMLTGESDAVEKRPGDQVLSGSVIVDGLGYATATKLGADAYANRFAEEARRFSLVNSELRNSLNRVLRWVAIAIGPVALLVVNSQIMVHGGWEHAIRSGSWHEAAVGSIAVIVAMIPLGLVLMTSIAFAVGAIKLSGEQVLVQELPAVEGLARVSIICLDKTGTLTDGRIAFNSSELVEVPNAPARPLPAGWEAAAAWFGRAPGANATAAAIAEGFPDAPRLTESASIRFNSARKWAAVSFGDASAPGTWALGAPGFLFSEEDTRAEVVELRAQGLRLAEQGLRVLVLAHSPEPLSAAHLEDERLPELLPVALLSLVEHVRSDAAQTLSYFAEQGVQVRIFSGDHPATVATIAQKVGLADAVGIDARHLPEDPELLGDLLETHQVFGRVTPEQKKAMVQALQSRGQHVAMTGDGINDALAIKQADMGIAMGSGSAATKAVAQIVLLDGQFSHLPSVVAEGRKVIANIERVSMLFFTKTAYITALALLFGVLIVQIPFLPRQLSATDGLTIGIPAFFLALLPNLARYRSGFLRRSLSFAIPAGLVVAAAIAYYTLQVRGQISEHELRTGTTLLVALLGLWVLVLVSMPLTVTKSLIFIGMVAGLALVYTVPLSQQFFQLAWPRQDVVNLIIPIALMGIVAISLVRVLQLRYLASLKRREAR